MSPTRIRAAVSREFRAPLVVEELELADPRPDEIRVAVDAVAVCHSDVAFIDREWDAALPAVWGHEASGTVREVGAEVDGLDVGDPVVVTSVRTCGTCRNCRRSLSVACTTPHIRDGETPLHDTAGSPVTHGLRMAAFAEQMVVHASQAVRIPTTVDRAAAALLGCGVISGFGAVVNTAEVEPGASVVVIGTGGVGLHAVQGARHAGADPVIAIDVDESKLALASRLGATLVADPRHGDAARMVERATSGAMADYVFVTTGAPAAIDSAYPLVGVGGALVLVGMPPTGMTMDLDTGTFAGFNQTVFGSKLGSSTIGEDIPLLVDLYQRRGFELDALVSSRVPFEEINEAIDAARSGDGIRNVVVFP